MAIGTKDLSSLQLLSAVTHLLAMNGTSSAGRIPASKFIGITMVEGGGDLNNLYASPGQVCAYQMKTGITNAPPGCNLNGAFMVSSGHTVGHAIQIIVPMFNATGIFFRSLVAGTWQTWKKLISQDVAAT